MIILKKLLKKIRESAKKKAADKMKKKAKKRLKKLVHRLGLAAVLCFGLVMVYQHRRPIMAAIMGKKLPEKKCPVCPFFKKG